MKNGTGFIKYGNEYKSKSEYLNGERNVITIEYDSIYGEDFLRFQGEYLTGKKNGKGKNMINMEM